MYSNAPEVTLTPRKDTEAYNAQMNRATFDILSIVFEFKVATSWQISRFLEQKDQSKHIYHKLRRMWSANLLESFKTSASSRASTPVYYMLSKNGLKALEERGMYDENFIQNYPQANTLFSWGLFNHESQVIELASMEAKNKSANFDITFKGEVRSGSYDFRSDKNTEVFTPDYTALYTISERDFCIYSEFERTVKSKEAMARKIERYIRHLTPEERKNATLRFIFQTPNMEQSFWLNIITSNPTVLPKLKIVTTNMLLLEKSEYFLEPVYASEKTVKLTKQGRLGVDTKERVKLFSFL